MNYTVIYTPESGYLEAFGPFDSLSAAKSWMAQDFNHNCEYAKKSGVDPQWTWNERTSKCLGSCSIEGIGSWEIVELKK